MKRVISLLSVLFVLLTSGEVKAAELVPVVITGYCLDGVTASGIHTREGICAYRREDVGKTARVYDSEGNLIGEYLIADTGKKGGKIRSGEAVDIWKATKEECYALTQCGYIEIVGEGE